MAIWIRTSCLFMFAILNPAVTLRDDELALTKLESEGHAMCDPTQITMVGMQKNLGDYFTVTESGHDTTAEIVKLNVNCAFGYNVKAVQSKDEADAEILVECDYSNAEKVVWKPPEVRCLPIRCPVPHLDNADVNVEEQETLLGNFEFPKDLDSGAQYNPVWYHGRTTKATCKEGYTVDGNPLGDRNGQHDVSCHAGDVIMAALSETQITEASPTVTASECQRVRCAEIDKGGNRKVIPEKVFGDTVQVECIDGYELTAGVGPWKCSKDGGFAIGGGTEPECKPKDCGDAVANSGNKDYATFIAEETTFGNAAKIQCNEGRAFNGDGEPTLDLVCTAEGIWNPSNSDLSTSDLCLDIGCKDNPTMQQHCKPGETFEGEDCGYTETEDCKTPPCCILDRQCLATTGKWEPAPKKCVRFEAEDVTFLNAEEYNVEVNPKPEYNTKMTLSCGKEGMAFDANKNSPPVTYVVGRDRKWHKDSEEGEVLSSTTVPKCQVVPDYCDASPVAGCNERTYGASCKYVCPIEKCREGKEKTVECTAKPDGTGGQWTVVGAGSSKLGTLNAESLLAQCTDKLQCQFTAKIDQAAGECGTLKNRQACTKPAACVEEPLTSPGTQIDISPKPGYNLRDVGDVIAPSGQAVGDTVFTCRIKTGESEAQWRNSNDLLANSVTFEKKSCGKIKDAPWWKGMFKNNKGAGWIFDVNENGDEDGLYGAERTLKCKSQNVLPNVGNIDDACFTSGSFKKNAEITITCDDQPGSKEGQWRKPTSMEVQQCVFPIGLGKTTSKLHKNANGKVLEYHTQDETPVADKKATTREKIRRRNTRVMDLNQLWYMVPTGAGNGFQLRPAAEPIESNKCLGAVPKGFLWWKATEGALHFRKCNDAGGDWEPEWELSCGDRSTPKRSICDGGSQSNELKSLCTGSVAQMPCSVMPVKWSGKSKFWLTFPRKSSNKPKVLLNDWKKMNAADRDLTVLTFWE